MGNIEPRTSAVDVICQHTRSGTIIPIKIRVIDEDGEFQSYQIQGYRELTTGGLYTMPNGVAVNNKNHLFECKIMVFNTVKIIRILYNTSDNIWQLF